MIKERFLVDIKVTHGILLDNLQPMKIYNVLRPIKKNIKIMLKGNLNFSH